MVGTDVDQAERYLQLALLGRSAFLASSAPAALVRRRADGQDTDSDSRPSIDEEVDTLVAPVLGRRRGPRGVEVYPLAKKPGASFADMITIGRTPNNDVVLRDVTISRFHAYFRQRGEAYGIGSYDHQPLPIEVPELRREHYGHQVAHGPFTPEHFESALVGMLG